MTNIKEYTINIPTHFNNGDEVTQEQIDIVHGYALASFGGYTYKDTPVQGAWYDKDNDKTYIETMTQLVIATDKENEIKDLCTAIRILFEQECIYCACTAQEVKFI